MLQDIRYAMRTLRKSPLFTLTVAATLAVGIGANTAIFSFVDVLLLRPLPYGTPDRLMVLWQDFSARGERADEWFTPPDLVDVREQSRTLDAVSMFATWIPNLTGDGDPERLTGMVVSPEYFSLLGITPAAGRAFTAEDANAGGQVVVISDALWQRRFGADAGVLGSILTLNGQPYTVLGITPRGFVPPMQAAEIWRPVASTDFAGCGRACYVMRVLARRAPGASIEQAAAELDAIARGIAERFPDAKPQFTIRPVPLASQLAGALRPALIALLGAVGLLLLIACANIANLLLARASGREREVALRVAIGAGRVAIVRQLLTESLLLGVLGGAMGVVLAFWGVDLLVNLSPPGTPRIEEVGVDGRIFAFALALSLGTGVLFGLVPSLQLARTNLTSTLKEGGPRSSGSRRYLRDALVVAELAIALTLLVGAGLLLRSFVRLQSVDPGFNPDNTLTVNLLLPRTSYPQASHLTGFYDELIARTASRPGVVAAAASSIVPMTPGGDSDVGFLIEGRPLPTAGDGPGAWYRNVTPDYFHAIGMRVLRGRSISEQDHAGAPPVVVINETMAARYWPGEDPIGKRISSGPDGPWVTVIGVVADVRHGGMGEPPRVEMFLPFAQQPVRAMTLVVRTSGDPLLLVSAVREEVRSLDPALPLASISTMQDAVSRSVALPRLYLSFFAFFAVVALLLAGIGIYGVTSYAVTQRTQEIGIRMALGAQTRDVLRLVVKRSMMLSGFGLVLGIAASLALSRTLSSLLFELSATDPATFATIAAVLLTVAFVASWTPASRAARVDPVVALRRE